MDQGFSSMSFTVSFAHLEDAVKVTGYQHLGKMFFRFHFYV